MKLTNIALVSMMSLFILSCGGGGESSSPTAPSIAPVVEEPAVPVVTAPIVIETVEPDPNAIYDTTAELIASKSFLLEQDYALDVSYKSEGNRSAYLSVCTEFTEGEYGIKVNYNSCLLRTSIDNDYTGTLTVANDQTRLVMAIWYLDDAKNPRYEIWENDSDTNNVKKFVVN
jgi:hypothetical protein